MRKRIFDNTKLLLLLFLYKCAIEIAYYYTVSPEYEPALYWNPNRNAFFMSLLFMGILVLTMPKDKERASFYVCLLFDILSVIPLISLYWMTDQKTSIPAMVIAMDVIIHLLLRIPVRKKIAFSFSEGRTTSVINAVFVIYLLTVVYFVINSSGVNILLLTLNDNIVYSVRSGISYGSFIMPYIFEWDCKVLFPFYFGIGLYENKKVFVLGSFISQMLLFLCYGNKLTILSMCLIIAVYICLKFKGSFEVIITLGATAMMAMLPVLYAIPGSHRIGKAVNWLVAMRTLFMPAMIKFEYFDFFSIYRYLYFSEGQIGRLFGITYPYDRPIGVEVSNYFFGEGNAGNHNAGIIADAYANMGFFGMILIAVIFALSFRIIDSFTGYFPLKVKIMLISLFAVYMNDNAFLTTLLTNGLLIMIAILGIYNKVYRTRKKGVVCKKETLNEI